MNIERPKPKLDMPADAKKIYDGVIFDVYQWQQKMFDAIVFPVMDDGKILLIEEQQPGHEPKITSPGGRIDPGEGVLDAVKRELQEETGYEAQEFILWHAVQPLQKIDWAIYTFIAKGLKKVSDQNLDGGEKITPKPVTLEQFFDYATNPDNGDKWVMAKVYEALLHPEKMVELKKLLSPQE